MQRHPLRATPSHAVRPMLLSSAALATSAALADEPNPYYVGVGETLARDSNVFRDEQNRQHDPLTSLLGGFDQPIGRQRFHATMQPGDVVSTERFGATVRLGGDSILSLEGGYEHNKVSYSIQSTGDSASVGLYYRVGPTPRLGTAARYSHSESPQGSALAGGILGPSKENVRYLDLLADWQPGALTYLYTRLSWTRQTNSDVVSRDFSGVTGAITGTYAPTVKLSFNASRSRDSGVNGNFFSLNTNTPPSTTPGAPRPAKPVTGLSESSQVSNAGSLGVNYAATSKIWMTANAQYRHAQLVDTDPVSNAQINRNDNSRQYSIGLTDAVARYAQVGCSFARSSRDLDAASTFAAITYTANVTSCTAQLTLR